MLFFVFGPAGSGKNFVGETIAAHWGYYFWDADLVLSVDMQLAIKNKKAFTQKMRDQLTQRIIDHVTELKKKHHDIVIAQALYKERNRKQIMNALPDTKFFLIQASPNNITARLSKRNNNVDQEYAKKIQLEFEEPLLPHKIIINDSDQRDIIKQFQFFL